MSDLIEGDDDAHLKVVLMLFNFCESTGQTFWLFLFHLAPQADGFLLLAWWLAPLDDIITCS